MGKEVTEQGLVSTSVKKKNIKFLHKLDMWGSFILLSHLYLGPTVVSTLSSNYVFMSVPNDLLMHGPIMLNLTDFNSPVKPLMCNPYFDTFRNSTYLTDEMKAYEKVKSDEFLSLPGVQEQLLAINDAQNHTETLFGMTLSTICQLIPPNADRGGCWTYTELLQNCFNGECGTDPNMCFWRKLSTVSLGAYVQAIFYVPAVLMTMGMMYDPPPANCIKILKPLLCALLYFVAGTAAMFSIIFTSIQANKLVPQIFFDTYSQFVMTYDSGWQTLILTCGSSLFFSAVYVYLAFFSPKYPRQKNRWDIRSHNFERSLEHISENVRTK